MAVFSTDTARWNAVQSREVTADGIFVYAVRTTRIYCRPVCKARLARRKNIEFYATNKQAQDAGYRPCKRCKPQELGTMPHEDGAQRVRQLLQQFAIQSASGQDISSPQHHPMTLGEMAALSGLSKWHFHRVFKQLTGVTPQRFFEMRREGNLLQNGSPEIREDDGGAVVSAFDFADIQDIQHQPLSISSAPLSLFDSLPLSPLLLDEPDFTSWPQLTDDLFDQQFAELEATWAQHNKLDFPCGSM